VRNLMTLKRWLLLNALLPAMGLIDGNNSTPPPTCHLPARPPTTTPIDIVQDNPWLAITLGVVIPLAVVALVLFGAPRARQYLRRRKALKSQLSKGVLTKEEFDRLR
jgi:hypothetical protein